MFPTQVQQLPDVVVEPEELEEEDDELEELDEEPEEELMHEPSKNMLEA